ncbi:Arm DNA-binding domain-containing protein [Stenotrophomonas indicatrix]|uniref:Arm DNA-binding domain-containing protein n=1 Tax=Stenotrophomonas indicatrix TaxID=2045451 RepID=UPI00320B91BA
MGLKINRLTARGVATVTKPGYHPDGGGLYLQVTASGAKSWVFRYRFEGRRPEMGLGPLHVIGLADARAAADVARRMVQSGQDPLAGRRAAAVAASSIPTFWEAATAYIAEREAGWTNPKHAGQWTSTLDVCHAGIGRSAGGSYRDRACPGRAAANLDHQNGDRQSRPTAR